MSVQRPGLDFAFGSPGSSRDISLAIFYALRNRPALDLRFLLRECERRLDDAGWCAAERSDAQTLAVDGIRAFADAHEQRLPTSKEYESWRKSSAAPQWLPNESKIRRAFAGSWKLAVRAADGGKPVDVVAARQLRAAGSAYTREELIEVIRAFVAETRATVARWDDYRAWATGALEVDPDRRVPSSADTFKKRGGFRALCAEAGVATVDEGCSPHRWYLEHEWLPGLVRAWEESGRPAHLTKSEYTRRRTRWLEAARTAGEPDVFPAADTIARRFGVWAKALVAAGIIDASACDKLTARQRTRRIDDEVGLEFLVEALTERGHSLGPVVYETWRTERTALGGAECPPSKGWFINRFGRFARARGLALELIRERSGTDGERS